MVHDFFNTKMQLYDGLRGFCIMEDLMQTLFHAFIKYSYLLLAIGLFITQITCENNNSPNTEPPSNHSPTPTPSPSPQQLTLSASASAGGWSNIDYEGITQQCTSNNCPYLINTGAAMTFTAQPTVTYLFDT